QGDRGHATLDARRRDPRTVGDAALLLEGHQLTVGDVDLVRTRLDRGGGATTTGRQEREEHGGEHAAEHGAPHAGPSVLTSMAAATGSTGPSPYAGHQRATGHAPQAGFLAWQMRRPCQIRWWQSITQSFLGNSAPMACSTLTGSVSSVQPKRRQRRPKWVSTVMPGMPKPLPSTTFAVLRPTPGSVTRSSRRGGTFPSYRSTSAALSLSRAS